MTRDVRLAAYRAVALRYPGRITSQAVSFQTGVNSSQVRRDLSQTLGRIGTRGSGYDTEELIEAIDAELSDRAASVIEAVWRDYRLLGMVLQYEAKAVVA